MPKSPYLKPKTYTDEKCLPFSKAVGIFSLDTSHIHVTMQSCCIFPTYSYSHTEKSNEIKELTARLPTGLDLWVQPTIVVGNTHIVVRVQTYLRTYLVITLLPSVLFLFLYIRIK